LLIEELNYRKNQFNINNFSTLYLGGGTPSLLNINQLKKLFNVIIPQCSSKAEITVEANPENINAEFLETLYKCGVNRLSVGIQSLSDKALKFVSRRASKEIILQALAIIQNFWLRQNEKMRFSVDFISGLPFCSNEEFTAGLKNVINSDPDHISLYSLTLEEKTPLYTMLKNYDEDKNTEQWFLGKDIIEKAGFVQYEVSNFCKPGYESRHNITYWRKNDYIGIGAGATGTIGAYRYTNGKLNSSQKYTFSETVEKLDKDTLEFEYIMMGLRTLQGIDENDFYKRFRKTLESKIGKTFFKWQKKKLAEKQGSWWTLGKNGILFLNEFLLEL
jgi:oxygen-independent coproporphyrinogen-3 oxidase